MLKFLSDTRLIEFFCLNSKKATRLPFQTIEFPATLSVETFCWFQFPLEKELELFAATEPRTHNDAVSVSFSPQRLCLGKYCAIKTLDVVAHLY